MLRRSPASPPREARSACVGDERTARLAAEGTSGRHCSAAARAAAAAALCAVCAEGCSTNERFRGDPSQTLPQRVQVFARRGPYGSVRGGGEGHSRAGTPREQWALRPPLDSSLRAGGH
eukprot:scaffold194_cov329-Prasinococcus_capsulatus_cf.AAC.5